MKVSVVLPEALSVVEVKLAVMPAGSPLADTATLEVKPLSAVVISDDVTLLPCVTETALGEAVNEKLGVAVTFSVTVVDLVTLLPAPVTVIE